MEWNDQCNQKFCHINREQEKHNDSPLYNIGSSRLHSNHGLFRNSMLDCQWEIHKILISMDKLFVKSPGRRDLFISTSSTQALFQSIFFLFSSTFKCLRNCNKSLFTILLWFVKCILRKQSRIDKYYDIKAAITVTV